MGVVIVDGKEVVVEDHERLNGIQAAARAGVDIPRYCWHPGLSVVASCRMCLVETGTRNPETGAVQMMPKLVPACQTPARDNTVFVTDTQKVKQARAFVEEALLIDHPIDCPICDKAGECYLQDYHFEHGQNERRADIHPFTSRRRELGDTVTLFVDRCVMCSRCVRFCREVAGDAELMVINRGAHEEIDVFPGRPLENKLSGNVVDLCPVGALGDRDFLYSQRVWFMKSHDGVCTRCSTGCSVKIDENQDHIYRLRPRENPHVNQWWMCDEGRYGYHHVHSEQRLVEPQCRTGGVLKPVEWSQMVAQLDAALRTAVANAEKGGSGSLAGVLSPHLTVEEAYLLSTYLRSLDSGAVLVLGPVVRRGEDEVFKNGFTIHAEKAPNRRGVEAVLRHFNNQADDAPVATLDDLLRSRSGRKFGAVWVTAGYPEPWIDEATAAQTAELGPIVLQDLFDSPLWGRAAWQLPGASFAERSGSYVNFADRLQSAAYAVRPPQGARVEGSIFWQLLKRPGLYRSSPVLEEAAAAIPYFAPAAGGAGPLGVSLAPSAEAANGAPAP